MKRIAGPLLAVVIGAAGLSACQTTGPGMVSVEEAKQAPLSFTAGSFIPPPRTITDITAVLDQQKLANPEAAVRAKAKADPPPPNTKDPDALAEFYHQRGLAAGEIGRARQEIGDLTEAARWASRGAGRNEHEILFWLAIAEIYSGNFSRAAEHIRQAIGKVPQRQRGWLVGMHGVLAGFHARAGDVEAAEAHLKESVRAFDESRTWWIFIPSKYIAIMKASLAQAQADVSMAKGQFAEAERFYRQAVAAMAGDAFMSRQPLLDYLTGRVAEALVRQERLIEAEGAARTALLGALSKRGRYSTHTASNLNILTYVIFEQGRFVEAETLARAAIDIYLKTGTTSDSLLLAVARTLLASTLVAQERWGEALPEYETILAGMAGDPLSYQKYLAGDFGWAMALLRTGNVNQALEVLKVALDRSQRLGEKYASTAQVRGLLGMAYAATGERQRALSECAEATRALLDRSPEIDEESTSRRAQDHFRRLILEFCIGLLADIKGAPLERQAGIDAPVEAFRLAEAARGRTVQRALDAGAARAAARVPALAELVRKEQDAKRKVSILYGVLANALAQPTDQQDAKTVMALRTQAETLRRARQALSEQIEKEFPAYAQLINPKAATVDQARAGLRPGEALIATYVAADRTYVWAIPHRGAVAFATVPLGGKGTEAAVAQLRAALHPNAKTPGDIPAFDLELAHRLYSMLLEPVRGGWQQAESLLVVPHGALGQLPFALLPLRPAALGQERDVLFANYRGIPWLIQSHAVSVLPSVTALVTLRALPPGDPTRRQFVGFGDPYFSVEQAQRAVRQRDPLAVTALSPRGRPITLRNLQIERRDSSQLAMLPRLPETAGEIRRIAQALDADPARDVYLGERASEDMVKTLDLSVYRVLAFATHGLVPGDLDGLTQPALALSAPEVAKAEGDGLLTMEEILGLRLNADWVVLSACNTASGLGAGAEAVSGLGRAFFYAGARALLVSHWPVETTSALALTTDLFRLQRAEPRLSRAKALQQTMIRLIDEGQLVDPATRQAVFSYAHPLFWAPFVLVGDSGGGAFAGK